jgi:hypothetical protein
VAALPPPRVPVALANFANDTVSIRRLAEETHRNLVALNVHGNGKHWAAHGAPSRTSRRSYDGSRAADRVAHIG